MSKLRVCSLLFSPYIAIRFKHPLTTEVVTHRWSKTKQRPPIHIAFVVALQFGINGDLGKKLLRSLILH